jgi:hypothetical protein
MKINQWTRALLATGVVGIGAVAQAEEAPSSNVLTAVSGTQISGYVSTSVNWAPNTMSPAAVSFMQPTDGFNLDVVDLKISKPLDEGEWSAGYNVELWAGPAADQLGNRVGTAASSPAGATAAGAAAGVAIKQANVQLNAPIGNGLVLTMGVFDTIIGYEVANVGDNPNYTRSYGITSEPFQHLGLLASYQVCEGVSASFGIADNNATVLNSRASNNSSKTYMTAVTVTAPEALGPLAGTSLTAGVVDGDANGAAGAAPTADITNIYVGATVPTPVENLSLGFAWDHVNVKNQNDTDVIAAYAGYKLSDKAGLNLRLDYLDQGDVGGIAGGFLGTTAGVANSGNGGEFLGTTVTLDYALWAGVQTRAEWRYDKNLDGSAAANTRNNNHLFALNVIYKF